MTGKSPIFINKSCENCCQKSNKLPLKNYLNNRDCNCPMNSPKFKNFTCDAASPKNPRSSRGPESSPFFGFLGFFFGSLPPPIWNSNLNSFWTFFLSSAGFLSEDFEGASGSGSGSFSVSSVFLARPDFLLFLPIKMSKETFFRIVILQNFGLNFYQIFTLKISEPFRCLKVTSGW